MDYGFHVVISTSFADIFYNNCFKNGLLPIILEENDIEKIIENIDKNNNFVVNLENQSIKSNDLFIKFKIDNRRKRSIN